MFSILREPPHGRLTSATPPPRRAGTAALGALLAFYLTFGVGSGEPLVLCVGANGHLAFERESLGACVACCDHAHDAGSEEGSTIATTEACGCGPCIDIPLPAGGRATAAAPRIQAPLGQAAPVAMVLGPWVPLVGGPGEARPPAPSRVSLLRSRVLLI